MPTASGAPLGNRLAAIANKHGKKSMTNSLKNMLNSARARGELRTSNVGPVYQNYFTPPTVSKEKVCGPKPLAWIGTQKNPAFEQWKKCGSPAVGGKRKTRKSKKSRRATRRR